MSGFRRHDGTLQENDSTAQNVGTSPEGGQGAVPENGGKAIRENGGNIPMKGGNDGGIRHVDVVSSFLTFSDF